MAVKFRDYYEVLGVPRTATPSDIKKAYRQLARKHHPDHAPPAERAKATERFKEINEANEVLSDKDKRARYDALGANWKSGMDFTPPPGAGRGARGTSQGFPGGTQWDDLGNFSDFFSTIFGQPSGRTGRRAGRVAMPGSDVEAELSVTIEEVLRGGKRRITLNDRTLNVDIPVGAREGTVLRLSGQGEPGTGGAPPGDLFLHVRLAPHSHYRASGDDLDMDLPLWPWQAVLGAEVRVETPDGPVKLKVPPGTQSGRQLRLRARGLPRGNAGRGDLHATVRIVVPEQPSATEKEAYEALKRAASAPADQPAES